MPPRNPTYGNAVCIIFLPFKPSFLPKNLLLGFCICPDELASLQGAVSSSAHGHSLFLFPTFTFWPLNVAETHLWTNQSRAALVQVQGEISRDLHTSRVDKEEVTNKLVDM